MNQIIKMFMDRLVFMIKKFIMDLKTKKLEAKVAVEKKEADNAVKDAEDSYVDFMDEYNKRKNKRK
jgi:hypothetical protein